MAARIFISYRTADGVDKATALARELGQRFGDDQVFLDKDDLRGGSSWRDEVGRALGAKPVLLLLLTPQFFAATGRDGALRIADPDDPVRREFAAALDAGAHVIPVCCDGVDAPPPELPAPFDRIGDYTWRRLRAYDWRADFERLASDLAALGVEPPSAAAGTGDATAAAAATGSTAARSRAGKRALALVLVSAVLAIGAVLAWQWKNPRASTPSGPVALTPVNLPGTWIATTGADPPFALTLLREDDRLALNSEPMPIDDRAGWATYRAFWLRLTGTELRTIRYRGRGTVITELGSPLVIDIAWTLYNGAGDTMIDSGNLHATAAADGRSLAGTFWSNGDQAERPVVLRRPR